MNPSRCRTFTLRTLAATATLSVATMSAFPAFGVSATAPSTSVGNTSLRALLASRELWATIDVCDTPHHPDMVGVRGSMPGDGQTHDRLYMSFRLQYLNTTRGVWVDLASGASPKFVGVGPGSTPRQGGATFKLEPASGKPVVTLRGVVAFQWRRGTRVLQSATRPTTVGHKSLSGADPKGYSASTCLFG